MNLSRELYARREALIATITEDKLDPEERKKLEKSLKYIDNGWYLSRIVLSLIALFGVNWNKKVSFFERELPIGIGLLLGSTISDTILMRKMWNEHEEIIKLYTSYENGFFIHPARLKVMRDKMKTLNKNVLKDDTNDEWIEDDENISVTLPKKEELQ